MPVKIEDWCTRVVALLSSFSLATATQQEADTEINTETLNKSSQPSSSVQPTPTETASTPKEKDVSTDKSKESVTVSIAVVTANHFKTRVLWNLPLKASLDQLGIYGRLHIAKCVIWGVRELWLFVFFFFSPCHLGKSLLLSSGNTLSPALIPSKTLCWLDSSFQPRGTGPLSFSLSRTHQCSFWSGSFDTSCLLISNTDCSTSKPFLPGGSEAKLKTCIQINLLYHNRLPLGYHNVP